MGTYNFTQHHLEGEQKLDGIIEPPGWMRKTITSIQTFRLIPDQYQMEDRARGIVSLALLLGADRVMIAPASFFASTLEQKLEEHGILSVYPYSAHTAANTISKEGYIQRSGSFEYVGLVEGNFEKAHETWDYEPVNDKILNLTRLPALPEQIAEGVIEPEDKEGIKDAITFMKLPTRENIQNTAELLGDIAMRSGCSKALINGTPYLMRALENSLIARNITPVYSLTSRRMGEYRDEDGTIKKIYDMKHLGFIEIDKERKRKQWATEKEKIVIKQDVKMPASSELDTETLDKNMDELFGELLKDIDI